MRLVWTTDPHLNHVSAEAWQIWINEIASHGADGVVITGDISEGDDVVLQLNRIAQAVGVPVYFVLGNHDFYQSSIAETRRRVIYASREDPCLVYLTDATAIELDEGVFLLGEDGWGDATEGDYEKSTIQLNDFRLIDEFQVADPNQWKTQLQEIGKESADRLTQKLNSLPDSARHVLIATHVPPFREACWYQGRTTDDNWAPFFVAGQIGQTLRQASRSRPECKFTILCGHTHNEGVAEICENLTVHTGAAEYGNPQIEGLVTISKTSIETTKYRD